MVQISRRVSAIQKKLNTQCEKKVRLAAETVARELVFTTPYRTGLAHANWITTVNRRTSKFMDYPAFGIDWSVNKRLMPKDHPDFETLQPEEVALDTPLPIPKFNLGDTIYFQNNVPYGDYLNAEFDWRNEIAMALDRVKSALGKKL